MLLTTATTILGLLPMVFEISVDFGAGTITHGSTTSDWWVLLSSAVVYGLAFSTVLTLVLTPVMLAAPTVLRSRAPAAASWCKHRFGWAKERLASGKPASLPPPAAAKDSERDIPHAAE